MRRVAVTGLGCVTPIGNDVASFWDSAINGRHGIGYITKYNTEGMKVKIAAEVKDFKPELFMEKSEIKKTDLFSQYAIAAATQAVTDSGIVDHVDPERFGVYVGSGIGGINTFVAETEKMLTKSPLKISPFFIPMIISNMASALVAMKFEALGVNMGMVSACTTSTHSIGEAYRAIKHGYADAMIAGGAEATINMLAMGGFTNCLALCESNDCDNSSMPYDKRRSGFVMGEGAGVIVLEELESAKKRGAKIYAEIVGYANTNDAYHMTAPHPDARCNKKMIELTLKDAGVSPTERFYINSHGTSTPLNDKIESFAIKEIFGELAYKIPISSTKSMTGHMLGAAGGVEAIASIKSLETGIVHPTVGLKEDDPECDLDYVKGTCRNVDIDYALSLNVGFGGHNAGLLLKKLEA